MEGRQVSWRQGGRAKWRKGKLMNEIEDGKRKNRTDVLMRVIRSLGCVFL